MLKQRGEDMEKRRTLQIEGSRLHYFTILTRLVNEYRGRAIEDIISKNLAKIAEKDYKKLDKMGLIGKIKSERTVWGYINNAQTLGLIKAKGSSRVKKGGVRRRFLSLTAFGEAICASHLIERPKKDNIFLNDFEKILYFRRFLEIDEEWNGKWFLIIFSQISIDNFIDENILLKKIAISSGLNELYTSHATLRHRIIPKLQWIYDLELVELRKKERGYRLTKQGYVLAELIRKKGQKWIFKNPYRSISKCYGYCKDVTTSFSLFSAFQDSLKTIYEKLQSLYERPPKYLNISTVRYLVCTNLLLRGFLIEDYDFDSFILQLKKKGLIDLASSPRREITEKGIVHNGQLFNLILVKS